jgi:hypothetical protein
VAQPEASRWVFIKWFPGWTVNRPELREPSNFMLMRIPGVLEFSIAIPADKCPTRISLAVAFEVYDAAFVQRGDASD